MQLDGSISTQHLVLTFEQYIRSLHITVSTSPSSAIKAYAAGSAITIGVAVLVELVIILRGLPRGSRAEVPRAPSRSPAPMVSIIVPSYREGERLVRAVRSLLGQDYPRRLYEIVIAGEASDETLGPALSRLGLEARDGTSAVIDGVTVRLSLGNEGKGKPAALNRAVRLARGEVIGVLDADGVAPPDAISRAVSLLGKGYAAVQLPRDFELPPQASRTLRGSYIRGQAAEMRLYNRFLAPALLGFTGSVWLTGSGYFVWRSDLEDVGYWTEDAPTEDLDLSVKLLAAGKRIGFAGGAPVMEEPLTSLRSLVRQKERWIRGSLLATASAMRGIRRTWPLVLIFIMPAWGYLITPWLGLMFLAGLNPQLALWTAAWSAAWLVPVVVYYVSAVRSVGKSVRSLPASIAVYMVAGLVSLPKMVLRRHEWRGSRS